MNRMERAFKKYNESKEFKKREAEGKLLSSRRIGPNEEVMTPIRGESKKKVNGSTRFSEIFDTEDMMATYHDPDSSNNTMEVGIVELDEEKQRLTVTSQKMQPSRLERILKIYGFTK